MRRLDIYLVRTLRQSVGNSLNQTVSQSAPVVTRNGAPAMPDTFIWYTILPTPVDHHKIKRSPVKRMADWINNKLAPKPPTTPSSSSSSSSSASLSSSPSVSVSDSSSPSSPSISFRLQSFLSRSLGKVDRQEAVMRSIQQFVDEAKQLNQPTATNQPHGSDFTVNETTPHRLTIYYPADQSQPLNQYLTSYLDSRLAHHRFYCWCLIGLLPLSASAAVLPGPNVFVAYNLYRLYGHAMAKKGVEELQGLINQPNMIENDQQCLTIQCRPYTQLPPTVDINDDTDQSDQKESVISPREDTTSRSANSRRE